MDTAEKNLAEALRLSEHEARLYVTGLQYEQATLSDLAEAASMARTAAYPPLKSLLSRGLMSSVKIGKRTHYRSIAPKQLPHILEQQRAKLDMAIDNLSRLISVPKNDFSTQYFSGTHGLSTASAIFLEQTEKNETWHTFENPQTTLQAIGEQQFSGYIGKRVEKGVSAKIIAVVDQSSGWIQERLRRTKEELVELVIVSPNDYPLNASIGINKDMIYMLTAQGIPFAVLIKNPLLAQTLRSVHQMVWDRYKK